MPGQTDHRTETSRRSRRRVRTRVAVAAAATMMAAGGAAAVAPSASAQGLPDPVRASYEAQHPYVQQVIGSTIVGSYAAVALPYLLWVCPALGEVGVVDPTSCAF